MLQLACLYFKMALTECIYSNAIFTPYLKNICQISLQLFDETIEKCLVSSGPLHIFPVGG